VLALGFPTYTAAGFQAVGGAGHEVAAGRGAAVVDRAAIRSERGTAQGRAALVLIVAADRELLALALDQRRIAQHHRLVLAERDQIVGVAAAGAAVLAGKGRFVQRARGGLRRDDEARTLAIVAFIPGHGALATPGGGAAGSLGRPGVDAALAGG